MFCARHARTDAAADRKDDALAAASLPARRAWPPDFLGRAADPDLQRVHIAHQAHAIAHAPLHFADILLLAPVQHVEAGVRQMVEAGVHFGVVVVDLDPVLRETRRRSA